MRERLKDIMAEIALDSVITGDTWTVTVPPVDDVTEQEYEFTVVYDGGSDVHIVDPDGVKRWSGRSADLYEHVTMSFKEFVNETKRN